jgi:hypothetical protein
MATSGKRKEPQIKNSVPFGNGIPPPVRLAVADSSESVAKTIMGWIAACVLIGLLLPLLGFLYVDILTAKHDVQIELTKVQELRRQIEQEKRKYE